MRKPVGRSTLDAKPLCFLRQKLHFLEVESRNVYRLPCSSCSRPSWGVVYAIKKPPRSHSAYFCGIKSLFHNGELSGCIRLRLVTLLGQQLYFRKKTPTLVLTEKMSESRKVPGYQENEKKTNGRGGHVKQRRHGRRWESYEASRSRGCLGRTGAPAGSCSQAAGGRRQAAGGRRQVS